MEFLNKAALYERMDGIRRAYAITGPLEPYALAARLGIKVSVYEFDSRRFSGAMLRGKNHSEIIISAFRSPEGRRFTAAHELVHWLLHSGNGYFCTLSGVSALEWQANEGAAELLMPYREFLPAVKNIRSSYLSDPASAARVLAQRFDVSPAMARSRMASLSGELAAYLSGVPLERVPILSRSSTGKVICGGGIDVF